MTIVDGAILLLVLLYGVSGYYRGFLRSFTALFGLMLTLGLTWLLYEPLASLLPTEMDEGVEKAVAFTALFLLLYGAFMLSVGAVYRHVSKETHQSVVNRIFGIIPGLADGIIMAALAVTIVVSLPNEAVPRDMITDSALGGPLVEAGSFVQEEALEVFGDALRAFVPKQTIKPGDKELVKLPFNTKKGDPNVEIEKQMLGLLNRERVQRGLSPLVWDARLQEVARQHSRDMLNRGYFSHYSPDGKSVMDRVVASDLKFNTVGENLALAPTLKIAHEGLMDSPGHRENILRKEFKRVGIGAIVSRPYGIMFTQVFAGKELTGGLFGAADRVR